MFSLLMVCLLFCSIKAKAELEDCNNINQTKTICKMVESYDSDNPPRPLPLKVKPIIHLQKVVDFDPISNTMTIFVKLMSRWNDSRITIKDTR